VAWKRVNCECPHCAKFGPKLILKRQYIRKQYLSIFILQCERCGYAFEHKRDGKSAAELRKKYHLTRHEESIIRRQAAQGLIKMMVEGKMPTNEDIKGIKEEIGRLASVAGMLKEIE